MKTSAVPSAGMVPAGSLLIGALWTGMLGHAHPLRADGQAGPSPLPAPTPNQLLDAGRAIEGRIVEGRSHLYQVTLAVGQFMDVFWEFQDSSPLVAQLSAPDGARLLERNGADSDGQEHIAWIAETAGDYR